MSLKQAFEPGLVEQNLAKEEQNIAELGDLAWDSNLGWIAFGSCL